MEKSLYSRTASGPAGVTWGGILAAVMLAALALPVVAGAIAISIESDPVLEGHDLEVKFETSSPQNYAIRYKYTTKDGSATSGSDYDSVSGTFLWPVRSGSSNTIVIKTKPDQLCEYDETVKVVLSEAEYYLDGWMDLCLPNSSSSDTDGRGWPCNFEAEAKIKEDPNDCQGGTFGE